MEGVVLLGIFWAAVYLGNKIDKLDKKQEELFIIMAKNQQKIFDTIIEIERNRNHD